MQRPNPLKSPKIGLKKGRELHLSPPPVEEIFKLIAYADDCKAGIVVE